MQTTLFMREHLEVVPGLVDCLPCIPGSVRFVGESCLQDDSDRHIDSFIVANCCSCKGYEFQPRVDLVTQGLDTAVKTPVGFHIQMVFLPFCLIGLSKLFDEPLNNLPKYHVWGLAEGCMEGLSGGIVQ